MKEVVMAKAREPEEWTSIIRPVHGWFDLHLAEIWRYRDLIMLFVRRDFVSIYKQTVLGPLWYIIQPLLTTLMFTVVFGKIARIPTDGLPPTLFYMSGIVAWGYFANCLNKTSSTFVANAGIFGKVWFPRLTVPISVVISNLVGFIIQLLFFMGFWVFFYLRGSSISLQPHLMLLPLVVFQMAALGLGFGIIVSSLTTRYRDLVQLVGFGVQLWMYATPVVYPASQIPERWRWILAVNPMAPVIELFRYAFFGVGIVSPAYIGASLTITFAVLAVGILLFSRIEKSFIDTV
jgi:lipopolysaccharide transport system permease protein